VDFEVLIPFLSKNLENSGERLFTCLSKSEIFEEKALPFDIFAEEGRMDLSESFAFKLCFEFSDFAIEFGKGNLEENRISPLEEEIIEI